MDSIFHEIERALQAGLYYMAVSMALTIPDICAALESEDGETSARRYKAWCNANLANRYPRITDVDMYSLRCGVVHQGRFGHPQMQYARIIFTIPNAQRNVFHDNILNDALNLDAVTFCNDVIEAARKWFADQHNNPVVTQNAQRLVQFRPRGLAPYVVGIPLIA